MAGTMFDALKKAGMNVKEPAPMMNAVSARELAKRYQNQDHQLPPKAASSLPAQFEILKSISNGRVFISELTSIVDSLIDTGENALITSYVVVGIVQLAHAHRDRLSGSKRSSFIKCIPILLEIKEMMLKKHPDDVAAFLVRQLRNN